MSSTKTFASRVENVVDLKPEILKATQETFTMLGISVTTGVVIGLMLGIILYITRPGSLYQRHAFYKVNSIVVDFFRAFPFIILMVALSPLAKKVAGTTIGPIAASVTLTIAAVFYFARLVEQNLREVDKGVIEAALSMGADPKTIIFKVLIPEALSGIVSSVTILTISILSASAAAGMIGGGGLGDLAIRHGHMRYQPEVIVTIMIILTAMVILIQSLGNKISRSLDKR